MSGNPTKTDTPDNSLDQNGLAGSGLEGVDALFVQAEHLAKDYSLFPDRDLTVLSHHVDGLIDEDQIKASLKQIQQLDVDTYIQRTVQPTQDNRRLGAKGITETLNGKIVRQQLEGPLYTAEFEMEFSPGVIRRVGIIGQDRTTNNGVWLPEHHRKAGRKVREFAEMALPIVYFIDTPGADAGELANSQNQAHSISQLIAETSNVDVPTLGIIIGAGYSGGAIPLAASNLLLSVRDGIFNTIQPQGLQSIARKYNLSWQECAKFVGVSPEELYTQGCIDGVIDYSPMDSDIRQRNLQKAIVSGLLAIEQASVEFVRKHPDILSHYHRSLKRYLSPSKHLQAVEDASPLMLASNPTTHVNVFGVSYRYMRYLTLRSRIHSISEDQYGRLSNLTVPEGDLNARVKEMQEKVFQSWFENPDKLIYDNELNESWREFAAKRKEIDEERNVLTRMILGEPKSNYEKAKKALLFNLSLSLYNRWKSSAVNNFQALIKHLKTDALPETDFWPELNQMTVIDVIAHKELRGEFLSHCHNLLIFNALYDDVITNLASIANEAMETRALSRESVGELLRNSQNKVLEKFGPADEQVEDFGSWLRYFLSQDHRGQLLVKVEEWKSIGFPQMNDSLFVILTYYFEKLLPGYFASEQDASQYRGAINPVRIGRRKDFWNRLTMGYQDLLIQRILREEKKSKLPYQSVIEKFFGNFSELDAKLMSANALDFPGFRLSIEDALNKGIKPCGLVTGFAEFQLQEGKTQKVGIAVSNMAFQAGAFDMASAEKFCSLLVESARQSLPVICFISSGGMQTKEGASALFSMAVVNDRITRFVRDNDLPIVMFGFGDCTGGAQASFVTHPLVQTYYFSGTNMPFAGQMVVPAYLPSTCTLSNYLSTTPGSMAALVHNPFSDDLNDRLTEVDAAMPMPQLSVEEAINRALSGFVPNPQAEESELKDTDPKGLMKPVEKVLIHARGCTAVKLIRKAQDNDIRVVLVASDPDMDAVPAEMLGRKDKLVCIGGNTSDESYLNAYSVLKVAEYEEVDALHPGIGFLSESPQFANLCVNNGINFVGPSVASMSTMGNKSNAIKTAQESDVPVVPGSHGILADADQALAIAEKIGFPVLLKAVNGGGGKGIQVVERAQDMHQLFNRIAAEARAAFGNGDLYLEKYVTSLRHIEVQLLRDAHGNTKVLGLRDCSVQRNNQKVIEESASTMLPDELKAQVMEFTKALAESVDYTGAGTVEFIYDLDANAVYFMEMNTRLQVEHPVTEATSTIDIVSAQFDVASGRNIEKLEPKEQGYAIELRITAEKAAMDAEGIMQLLPSPGKVTSWSMPEREDMEIIAMVEEGKEVSPYYDSLICQLICRGNDREDVVNKLIDYLDQVVIKGISTNIPLLQRILKDDTFRKGVYDTTYLPKFMATIDHETMIAEMEDAASGDQTDTESLRVGDSNELKVIAASAGIFYTAASPNDPDFVKEGDIVSVDTTLGLMEAMKMFTPVTLSTFNKKGAEQYPSDKQYRIERIMNTSGQQVSSGDLLFIVSPV